MTIIIFIAVLSILILVHELGHFIAAKKNNVMVEEFGLGYPPRLLAIKIGETLYSLNLLPFGGFTKLYGEERAEISEKNNHQAASRAFVNKSFLQKIFILLAGVLGNFILGWVIISYLFTQGVPVPVNKVIVQKVAQNSPAAIAGIKKDDVIIGLEKGGQEEKITTPDKMIRLAKKYAGSKTILTIQRGQKKIKVELTPRKNPPPRQGAIGIMIDNFQEKKYPWYQAPFYGLKNAVVISAKVGQSLAVSVYQLLTFNRTASVQVTGPIGIAVYTAKMAKFGTKALLEFVAILSLNLAVINLIPFPALDGGRIAFLGYELVTKRKINKELEAKINFIGFSILVLFLVVVSVADVKKFFLK